MNAVSLPRMDRRLTTTLRIFAKELNLSVRTYARILILARRIAEWSKADRIGTQHLLDAIQFCTLSDRP